MALSDPSPGIDPVLPGCTRRTLLCLPPALLGAALLPAPAWAEGVTFDNLAPLPMTPCLALFHEWHRLDGLFQTLSDEEGEATFQQLVSVEQRLSAETATCLADLAAKVLILTQIRDDLHDTPFIPALLAEMEEAVCQELEAAVVRGLGG